MSMATRLAAFASRVAAEVKSIRTSIPTITPNVQTTSYVLVLSDLGKVVEVTNSAAVSVTIPANASVAFPVGAIVEFMQGGAGQVTIVADTGVIIRTTSTYASRRQYSQLSIRQRAVNEWVLSGDLA